MLFVESKQQFDYGNGYEIIFIGDSHTADSIIPSIITEKTGLSAFNFGVYHLAPVQSYYLTKDILASVKTRPKYVVLGTNPDMFQRDLQPDRYTSLFIKSPLILFELMYATNDKNLGLITASGKKMDLFAPAIDTILTGQKPGQVRRLIKSIDNGYLQNVKHYSDKSELKFGSSDFHKQEFRQIQIEYFEKTIKLLKDAGVEVLIINPPLNSNYLAGLRREKKYTLLNDAIENISEKYDVVVLNKDRSIDESFQDEEFLNCTHLCYPGAIKYSEYIAKNMATRK